MTHPPDLSQFDLIVGRELGRGATGSVFEAEQLGVGRRAVAVKVFNSELFAATQSLEREVESTIRLRHPNLVSVFGGNTASEPRFLILELAEPRPPSLPLSLAKTVDVGIRLCSVLAVAHAAGIVHSDIKPDNILWHQGSEPLLGDFGTARIQAITAYRGDLGFTPLWSPPWIPELSADAVSDVWSLAGSLIWMHWEWDPTTIDWREISADLAPAFQAAMPRTVGEGSLGVEPALEFGRLLQRVQAGRSWPITSFPGPGQRDYSPTAQHQATVHPGAHAPTNPAQATTQRRPNQITPTPLPSPEAAAPTRGTPAAGVRQAALDLASAPTQAAPVEGTERRWRRRLLLLAFLSVIVAGAVGGLVAALDPGRGAETVPDNGVANDSEPSPDSTSVNSEAAGPDDTLNGEDQLSEGEVAADADRNSATSQPVSLVVESEFVATSDRGGDLDIYLHRVDGTVEPLIDRDGDDRSPSLSPDGTQVVFESNTSGTRAVFVAPVDGSSEPRQLSPSSAEATDPVWSPDGGSIAWASLANGNWDIVIHDVDSVTEVFVVTSPSDDRNPSWSADSGSLVFRSDRTGNGDIYLLRLADQTLRQVTTDDAVEDQPVISSDGVVGFERRLGDDIEVFSVDVEGGGEPARRTNHVGFDGSPTFDGSRLVYVRHDSTGSTIVVDNGVGEAEVHASAGLTDDVRVD